MVLQVRLLRKNLHSLVILMPPRPASHSERAMPGGKPAVQSRGSIKAVQRSRSAGHPPLTPNRKTSLTGNSRSCPPARLKSSPISEVIKSGRKTPKDVSPRLDHGKKNNQGLKGKQRGPPLRRAGLDTSRKLGFFTKPDGIPKLLFFLLYAAWVRSRAERPSVSYTKVVMEVAWTGHNLQFTKTN